MPDNLRPLDIAREMAAFIRRWRSEISVTKDLGVTIDEQRLADFLLRMDAGGLPTTLVAYTVLYCEWSFRLRRATNEDVERAMDDMVSRLCGVPSGPFSLSQAQLLVSAIAPGLRKQLSGTRIPIAFGVGPETLIVEGDVRRTYTPLIPTRRGSLPVVGPIVAGLVTEALWEQHGHESRPAVGAELCAMLLKRKIVPVEYAKWKQNAGAVTLSERDPPGVAQWLAKQIDRSHQRGVAQHGLSARILLDLCAEDPLVAFADCAAVELIQCICTLPWNAGKTGRIARK